MLFRSSRVRLLMVMPLDSARWTAFPEATWACLNGICSEKQRPQSVARQLGCFSKEKMDVLSFLVGLFSLRVMPCESRFVDPD